ncbi:transporter substrate-binding domain-containing protein [Desulfopila inferna]|uniref:transporter substrate-binding domain-containing protein n=1 Tax=Desulfopila inferna TaxID=468528 RepID=UPI0019655A6E|nr:transporter substrate-binding domain-containing protein [Desulfopila inferna]MBM9606313.1 transporter substrate-binding domain-containing protein [Desulfopila inferna]
MKKPLWIMQVIALFTLVFCLAGLGSAASIQQQLARESTLESIIRSGVIRVGMDTFLPWAMKSTSGEYIGFEIDVARRLAEDMGVKVEFVPTKWAGIIPALLTSKFDVIIGGMGITPQRALKVNFSIPYDYSGMSIVAHKEKAEGFSTIDDFNKPEVEIACKLGTSAAAATKKYLPEATVRLYDDEAQTYQELRNGKVHAVVASAPRPAFEAIKYSDSLFMPLKGTFTQEPIGFAIRKGDPDMLAFLNSWITNVNLEGWLKERHDYWFETRDWADLLE